MDRKVNLPLLRWTQGAWHCRTRWSSRLSFGAYIKWQTRKAIKVIGDNMTATPLFDYLVGRPKR